MVTQDQKTKAETFLKLHTQKKILVLLNSWDPGSSKLIEAAGFKAVATTSMGVSASLGYPDCQKIPFSEMTDAIKKIASIVTIPVTADIEGGFGNNIDEILSCIGKIIATGIVGINIEDSVNLNPNLVEIPEFCERLQAIRGLSDTLGFHLVINARTDVFLTSAGAPEGRLKHAIDRGNKYREAGADCIFVPGVWSRDDISTLVKEIAAPVNILANPTNAPFLPPSVAELEELGVARLSLGASAMKAALLLLKKIAGELLADGSYNTLYDALTPLPEASKAYAMATGTPIQNSTRVVGSSSTP
ncbi:MAG: isocitrate lyase/phosphoenolpyruvate mutase family protein [Ignavibacteria bacterium]|jgi:2-methylisocitrate lyase-like PEP mutase family enzyme|nr:isocitrate lyase/phosphoenolpyruvate mutase family protein [Ignavibacteria bacterium]MCU7517047.1 isocitrate lyase/phosphoenolpyruvate mutase family protein [Ignavibacteria bacterium]